MMLEIVFWTAAALIVYVYVGYPALLGLVARFGDHEPVRRASIRPSVTLIVSAYNEEAIIGEKVANSLALDYPPDRLEILVVSDASSDATDAIVGRVQDPRVRLLRMSERGGKTVGLNAALRQASGQIIVFSDANAMYCPDAIVRLVENFADPRIGAVIGESTYSEPEAGADHDESLYWRYETGIKRLESSVGSVVGGDGAIYAIRRQLYREMRADALSDFVNPLQIVRAGHRCVYEPAARSVEKGAGDFDREFRRKVRIVNRGWRAVFSMKDLLNPFQHGFFALEILSHKLLRWLIPVFLLALLVSNAALVGDGLIYNSSFVAQLLLYCLASAGYFLRTRTPLPRAIGVPFYFVLVNVASARGIIEAHMGRTYTTWTTARSG